MPTKEIISIIVAAVAALVWAILEIRRWRYNKRQEEMEKAKKKIEKENDLLPNPTRCADHEGRLRKVEEICTQYKTGHEDLVRRVGEVGADVKTLINMHLKQ